MGGVGWATVSGEHVCAGKSAAALLSITRSGLVTVVFLLLTSDVCDTDWSACERGGVG